MNLGHDKEYGSGHPLDSDEAPLTVGGRRHSALKYLLGSFAAGTIGGIVACLAVQASLIRKDTSSCLPQVGFQSNDANAPNLHARAEPWVGSAVDDSYPPATPTNYFPSLFPTEYAFSSYIPVLAPDVDQNPAPHDSVGYLGATETGAEPGIVATAPSQPIQTGAAALVAPPYSSLPKDDDGRPSGTPSNFNIFRSWGNLSPWYSVPLGAFGINESSAAPAGCDVEGVHILYRHGARYPTSGSGTQTLANALGQTAAEWNATGNLAFLNTWTYKLGEEILTAFGRQQEFDLGVWMRLKYGFLLNNFTAEDSLPIFRTTSQDRMLASTVNFGLGFFGWPTDGQYELAVTIESSGINNTLAPYETCNNANADGKSDRSNYYVNEWIQIYLCEAQKRLQADIKGFNLTISDVYDMQMMCAYETVAIGYSAFCELFTKEEWEGFEYSIDLGFWYNSAFGSPVAAVQGLGYIQELVSRLTRTPIAVYNSSTNSTWDANPSTWPLGHSLYADATHDTVIANILTALGLQSLARTGPLPSTEIPADRSFRVSQIAPFGSNVEFQLLSCPAEYGDSEDGQYVRIILNDGPVPLTGVGECPESSSGLCPLSTFVAAQRNTSETVDWAWGCLGNWTVPEGPAYETTTGMYPPPA